jgi:hypothetical protein
MLYGFYTPTCYTFEMYYGRVDELKHNFDSHVGERNSFWGRGTKCLKFHFNFPKPMPKTIPHVFVKTSNTQLSY